MKHLRIYLDTSVFGGCEDEEFAGESKKLLDQVVDGMFTAVVSDLVVRELSFAPESIRQILRTIPNDNIEEISTGSESEKLRNAYLASEVLGNASQNDALHVALATVAKVDLIVSWNFKHIVHFDKIRMFNSVNLREGYGIIDIRSPLEVV